MSIICQEKCELRDQSNSMDMKQKKFNFGMLHEYKRQCILLFFIVTNTHIESNKNEK